MAVSHRTMIFSMLGHADLTSVQRAVGMVMILRSDNRLVGPWKGLISWRLIATMTGLSPAMCQDAFEKLCEKGWFEIQTRADDGATRYVVAQHRRAEAAAYRDELRAKQKEKAGVPA